MVCKKEVKDYELLDGKRIPLRYFKVDLSSRDIALVCICIASSFLYDFEFKQKDTKLSMQKIDLFNKLSKVMGCKSVDLKVLEKLKEAMKNA